MSEFYVAIRKYKDVPGSPQTAPGEYPEKVVLLGSSQTPPDNSGVWHVMTQLECANLKKSLKNQWNAHLQAMAAQTHVKNRIKAAMDFGKDLMAEYGAQNVLSGKNTAQVTQIAVKLSALQALLISGSLYAALEEIDRITADSLVTETTKNYFKIKIQKYLGI